tara:strand:+ start:564 stop:902 length:339 start_codon:yes stop_codon:yes gene_type:complete
MTFLPKDSNDQPIPALRLKDGGAHTISAESSAAVNATPFDVKTRIISVYASVPVYLKFGASDTVSATSADHYFPNGVYYDVAIGGDQTAHTPYISVLRAGDTDGDVYISEKI